MRRAYALILFGLFLFPTCFVAHAQEGDLALTRIGRGSIQNVEWHPSGRYFLVATVTGAYLYTPDLQDLAYLPDAQLATISPDGRYISGTTDAQTIYLWDAQTLEPLRQIPTSMRRIWNLTWHPSSTALTIAGETEYDVIVTVDVEPPHRLRWLWGADRPFYYRWSPTGKHLAVRTDPFIRVYDFDTRHEVATIKPSYGESAMVWADDTYLFLSTSGEISQGEIHNIHTGEAKLLGDLCTGGWAIASPIGPALYIACHYGVKRLDAETLADLGTLNTRYGYGFSFAFHDDNVSLALWSSPVGRYDSSVIEVFNTQTGEVIQSIDTTHQDGIWHLLWQPGTRRLLVVGSRSDLALLDVETGLAVAAQTAHADIGPLTAWSSDGQQIAAVNGLNNVEVWDAASGERQSRYEGLENDIVALEWQPSGSHLATRTGRQHQPVDAILSIWDTRRREEDALVARFTHGQGAGANTITWTPDGAQLVSIQGGALRFYDISAAPPRLTVSPEARSEIYSVLWNSNGTRLVANRSTLHSFGTLSIYDMTVGRFQEREYAEREAGRSAWAWTPNGELLLLYWGPSHETTTPALPAPTLIRPEREADRLPLLGMIGRIHSAGFSPRVQYAYALDESGDGLVWDIANGAVLSMLYDVGQLVWSPDEEYVALLRYDGSIWIMTPAGDLLRRIPNRVLAEERYRPSGLTWSPDSRTLAHTHNGLLDLWHLSG